MDLFMGAIAIVWGVRILLNILSFTHLWWVKEYRSDRMRIHLGTPQGKRIFWLLPRRPQLSPKSLALMACSTGTLAMVIWSIPAPILLRMLVADLISFPLTWLFVIAFAIPTRLYHRVIIALAVQKLRAHHPMTVIGVTGSYGKTSTKEYLATILAAKYTVLKTKASKNSSIGIAEVIRADLRPEHEVFVVEMGAYKTGEIREMSEMVRPEIGIVTAINAQHQDLFGSLDNTMSAKYELLAGLTGRKIAIVNGDDLHVQTMAQWAKRDGREVWEYKSQKSKVKSQKENGSRMVFTAEEIKASFEGIEFTCVWGQEKVKVKAAVLGAHQAANITAAIAGAVAAGMSLPQAAQAAGVITANPKSLSLIPGINGSIYINDTFNNSPESAIAALMVLNMAKGKKYLVFQPMIELGSFAQTSHDEVGARAGQICESIILTNDNFYDAFMRGVRSITPVDNVSVLHPHQSASRLRITLKKGDAVLFKGKEAGNVLQALKP
ncbi:hypothetical protein HY949_00745 [Candidatus Gottesmanbacteria bacterium]|nr:hypothetical protein [Candidatus Gottesmanbacteria bacterium]